MSDIVPDPDVPDPPEPEPEPTPAIDAATLDAVRQWTGSAPDDATVAATFAIQRTVERCAYWILRRRLADLLTAPTSFTVPGDWSQSTDQQIAGLRTQLDQLATLIGDPALGGAIATVTRLARRDPTRGRRLDRWVTDTGEHWSPDVAW